MNDIEFNSLLSIVIVPQVVDLISTKESLDDISAIKEFYNSKTYEYLSQENTKVWHYSPLMLYTIWKEEKETGKVCFPHNGI